MTARALLLRHLFTLHFCSVYISCWDVSRTVRLEDSENLVPCSTQVSLIQSPERPTNPSRQEPTSNNLDLGDTMGITKDDTNLRGGGTLPGKLADLLVNLLGSSLRPGGSSARVGDGGGRNALAIAVKSTHFESRLGC